MKTCHICREPINRKSVKKVMQYKLCWMCCKLIDQDIRDAVEKRKKDYEQVDDFETLRARVEGRNATVIFGDKK